MNDERKSGFTVNDRRHFTPSGETRSELPSEQDPLRTETPTARPREPIPAPAESSADRAESADAPDFSGLLLSLAAQAGYLLGGRDESGEAVAPDLAGASGVISLLEILKEKTEGHRTAEEDQILQRVLYDLRMAFVAVSQRR